MVLGSHFLTTENLSFYYLMTKIKIFQNIKNALRSYEHGQIYLHSFIWLKLEKNKRLLKETKNIIEISSTNKKVLNFKKQKFPEKKNRIKYIRTTSGRILLNQIIKSFL